MSLVLYACLIVGFAAATSNAAARPSITVRNNHDLPYTGPVAFRATLPDGFYAGEGSSVEVRSGAASGVVGLGAKSEVVLARQHTAAPPGAASGPLEMAPRRGGIVLKWGGRSIGEVEFGLAVVPGDKAGTPDSLPAFRPLDTRLERAAGGAICGKALCGDYEIDMRITAYRGGWIDMESDVTRVADGDGPAYVALVRRVSAPGRESFRMRWNGRLLEQNDEPDLWDRDFWYTRHLDWCSWNSGGLRFAALNRFTPGPTIERQPGLWGVADHFYVWEHVKSRGDHLYLISEIAGPNPEQAKSKYIAIKTYAQPPKGESVRLGWRLAIAERPAPGWEESQFHCCAGYRQVTESGGSAIVDLGVPWVEFGTSYFPYSTLAENFDFYRTPGLDREAWWPFSASAWEGWREFIPRMETDLRIIRSMGFDWVRLHHLELLGQMDRTNALAFLDHYMQTCRDLGLRVMVDTAGSPQWVSTIAGRYSDVVKRIELENEVLIPGIKPGDAERWTDCYNAAKDAAPETEVFLTACCNQGMFDRLLRLGVPFDRAGFHSYKHGPGWEETFRTLPLAVAGHASDLGKPPVLGEFNWKNLTEFSPEARTEKFALIYSNMLESRSVPEFFQFHFQETLCVNPALARSGIRHYETIHLDRTPKPEAVELMKFIRRYCRPDSPARELPIRVGGAVFRGGRARAEFSIANRTGLRVEVRLVAESFEGVECRLASGEVLSIEPGAAAHRVVELALGPEAHPGTYHYFIRASCDGSSSLGWGIVRNPGAPAFEPAPVLADLVDYPQGAGIVDTFDWSRPLCVAFGTGAPVLDMEMAYMIFNTLQSAIGRPIRLCGTADIPASLMDRGSLVLVGAAAANPLIARTGVKTSDGKGTVWLHDAEGGRQWLVVTGGAPDSLKAAAVDLVLRYWSSAKDSTTRVTGLEKGAALGNRIRVGEVNPP